MKRFLCVVGIEVAALIGVGFLGAWLASPIKDHDLRHLTGLAIGAFAGIPLGLCAVMLWDYFGEVFDRD